MTPWWFENNLLTRCVSCSVRSPVSRPSPKLASSRLRQRLLGAAASQTSRRKPCYRQSDLFSNSSWPYYFTHHVLQCSSSAHCQKLLAWTLSLKQKASSSHKYLPEQLFASTKVTCLADGINVIFSFDEIKKRSVKYKRWRTTKRKRHSDGSKFPLLYLCLFLFCVLNLGLKDCSA